MKVSPVEWSGVAAEGGGGGAVAAAVAVPLTQNQRNPRRHVLILIRQMDRLGRSRSVEIRAYVRGAKAVVRKERQVIVERKIQPGIPCHSNPVRGAENSRPEIRS